jgi:hypothetical protein
MYGGAIGGARHEAVEDIELADKMAFADAANRRIARHLPEIVTAKRQQPDLGAAARRRRRSFAACVARADD